MKHQISGIWLTVVYLHSCQAFISLTDLFIFEKSRSRIYNPGNTYSCQSVIMSTLPVRSPFPNSVSFDTVGTCKGYQAPLSPHRILCHCCGCRESTTFSRVSDSLCTYSNWRNKCMRHCVFYRCRNIDDRFIISCRLPYSIQHRIAHFYRIVHFCSVETLRAVFECKVTVCSHLQASEVILPPRSASCFTCSLSFSEHPALSGATEGRIGINRITA